LESETAAVITANTHPTSAPKNPPKSVSRTVKSVDPEKAHTQRKYTKTAVKSSVHLAALPIARTAAAPKAILKACQTGRLSATTCASRSLSKMNLQEHERRVTRGVLSSSNDMMPVLIRPISSSKKKTNENSKETKSPHSSRQDTTSNGQRSGRTAPNAKSSTQKEKLQKTNPPTPWKTSCWSRSSDKAENTEDFLQRVCIDLKIFIVRVLLVGLWNEKHDNFII
jgi:hypothetical protein